MTRRRKYKRLLWWRKWMKEANSLQLRDALYDHIADLPEVEHASMCTGGWDKGSVEVTLKDGVTQIYQPSFFVKDALKMTCLELYLIHTQKLIYGTI